MNNSILRYRSTGTTKNSIGKRIVSSKSLVPILFVVSIIFLACLQIWQRVYVIGLVKEVSLYEKENKQIKDLIKKAELENIELSRLSRIEPMVAESLGLAKTSAVNLFTLQLEQEPAPPITGIGEVVFSLKKIADNFPVINETRAETVEIFETDD